jgi:probable HAF family extracellular repeat protein
MRSLLRFSLTCLIFTAAGLTQTAPTFKFVSIDFPGSKFTVATGVNNSGVIVGYYGNSTGTHGFRLANAHFSTINVPGAVTTLVNGINGNGDVVGTFQNSDQKLHGFLLHKGVITKLNSPAAGNGTGTAAMGVNDQLTVVGTVDDVTGFIWNKGVFRAFHAPSDIRGATNLNGISNPGWIVGAVFFADSLRPFMFHGSDFDFLRAVIPGDVVANGVNGRGDVVGSGGFGFLMLNPEAGETSVDKPEKFPVMHAINFPGSNGTTLPFSINFSRSIVGQYSDSHNHLHGFLAIVK